jgi:hypothetical protein
MDIISNNTRKSLNLLVPFALAGWVFYDSFVKKGKTDWKNSGIMSLIVFLCCYIVVTQTTRLLVSEETRNAAA